MAEIDPAPPVRRIRQGATRSDCIQSRSKGIVLLAFSAQKTVTDAWISRFL